MGDNLYDSTLAEVEQEAPAELVKTLKEQMLKIKQKFVHTAKAVDDCLPALENKPSVMKVLLVCYILNGGVLLKHVPEEVEEDLSFLNDLSWSD